MLVDTAVGDLAPIPVGPRIQLINGLHRIFDSGAISGLLLELLANCPLCRGARLYDITGLAGSSAIVGEQVHQPEIPGGYLCVVFEDELCPHIILELVSSSGIVRRWRGVGVFGDTPEVEPVMAIVVGEKIRNC